YKGLIALRNSYDAFRRAEYKEINFFENPESKFGLGYILKHNKDSFIVLFNADPDKNLEFQLPEGVWSVLVDKDLAGAKTRFVTGSKIILEPVTGAVLKLQ
ncbi:MAG: alpha-amylase family glycosyl hydrolase, partial [Melioribacteraceae bacterium]